MAWERPGLDLAPYTGEGGGAIDLIVCWAATLLQAGGGDHKPTDNKRGSRSDIPFNIMCIIGNMILQYRALGEALETRPATSRCPARRPLAETARHCANPSLHGGLYRAPLATQIMLPGAVAAHLPWNDRYNVHRCSTTTPCNVPASPRCPIRGRLRTRRTLHIGHCTLQRSCSYGDMYSVLRPTRLDAEHAA